VRARKGIVRLAFEISGKGYYAVLEGVVENIGE